MAIVLGENDLDPGKTLSNGPMESSGPNCLTKENFYLKKQQ